jgi:hypothetical protein
MSSGPFGDEVPMEATEYGGDGGGLSTRAVEVAKGYDLPGRPSERIGMVYRAPRSGDAALDPVDPATGLPAITTNP